MAVVLFHVTIALNEFYLDPFILGSLRDGQPRGLDLAGYGVSIFFVVSGFLITYLLQTEKKIQPIDVKKFYLRRILRIWPLYYLYLVLIVIIMLIIGLQLNVKPLFFYVFFAANVPFIVGNGIPLLSHYWSLGVEEQFYLFWPWVNKKVRSLILLLIALIFILIGAKITLHYYFPDSVIESVIYVTRFQCMMIGALGAVLYKQNNKLFLRAVDNKFIQLFCWGILILVAVNKFHIASVIDNEIISLVAMFIIIGQVNIKNRVVNLELNVLDFLGKISYGIYVIHPLVIFLLAKALNGVQINLSYKYMLVYFCILSTTVLFSYFSYKYFEKYFLNLKKKFTVVRSSDTKN